MVLPERLPLLRPRKPDLQERAVHDHEDPMRHRRIGREVERPEARVAQEPAVGGSPGDAAVGAPEDPLVRGRGIEGVRGRRIDEEGLDVGEVAAGVGAER